MEDLADDIRLSSDGKVFVTGHFDSDETDDINYDIVTFFVHEDGTSGLWVEYNDSDSSDVADIIEVKDGSVYLGGSSWDAAEQRNMLALKYNYVVGIDELSTDGQFQLYPNPVTDNLLVVFEGTEQLYGSVIITDLSGRILSESKKQFSSNETFSVSELSPGVYFITFNGDQKSITKSFIKL